MVRGSRAAVGRLPTDWLVGCAGTRVAEVAVHGVGRVFCIARGWAVVTFSWSEVMSCSWVASYRVPLSCAARLGLGGG